MKSNGLLDATWRPWLCELGWFETMGYQKKNGETFEKLPCKLDGAHTSKEGVKVNDPWIVYL